MEWTEFSHDPWSDGECASKPAGVPVLSPVVRINRSNILVDTLVTLVARSAPDIRLTLKGEWLSTSRQPYNTPSFRAARQDGAGLVVAEVSDGSNGSTLRCTILVFDADGKQTMATPYNCGAVRISAAAKDSVITEFITRSLRNGRADSIAGARSEITSQVRAQIVVPEQEPPVTHLLAGNDGSVWIREERTGNGGPLWRVFD